MLPVTALVLFMGRKGAGVPGRMADQMGHLVGMAALSLLARARWLSR
jgi:hypothetical protein